MRPLFGLSFAASAIVLAATPVAATTFTTTDLNNAKSAIAAMSQLNLFVKNDATFQSEVEGKAWVGGNATGSVNIGAGAADGQGYVANKNISTFTVGKDASSGFHIKNGIGVTTGVTAQVGGNSTGNYFDGTTGTLKYGGTVSGVGTTGTTTKVSGLQSTLQTKTNTMAANFATLSQILASAVINTTFVSSDQNNLHFSTSSTSSLLVASVNASALSTGTLLYPTLSSGQTLVVNVLGTNVNIGANPGGSVGDADNQNIIWNFVNATDINFGTDFHGSVLAPTANIHGNGPLEGSVVASVFGMNGEVHLGTYNGNDSFLATIVSGGTAGSVPEPASWMTMIAGFGLVGGALRRHRRRERLAA